MRRVRWILLALALSALALPVFGEEIVYFKSGSAMPVASHKIDGDMIHVDLGDNAFMAFPLSMIDRVERAGKNVMLQRSSTGGTNVMQARPDPTGSFPVRGSRQSRNDDQNRFDSDPKDADPTVEMDASGVQVYRPWGNSNHPGKARVGLAWNQHILDNSGAGYNGATPIGNRQVIGSTVPRRRTEDPPPPKLTGIEFRPTPRSAPDKPDTQGGDSGSQSGSDDSGSKQ